MNLLHSCTHVRLLSLMLDAVGILRFFFFHCRSVVFWESVKKKKKKLPVILCGLCKNASPVPHAEFDCPFFFF